MPRPGDTVRPSGEYEVAVAVAPVLAGRRESPGPRHESDDIEPGFEQVGGFRSSGRKAADFLLEKGDDAVRIATEAIGRQVGLAAQRIAAAIDAQTGSPASPGSLSVESVEVSFGVTLSSGVEALFTATAESSAQVTIVLSRRPADPPALR